MARVQRRLHNATVSRLKAFLLFFDNFTRTTSTDLGKSTSNGLWKAIRGTWFADGNSAKTSAAASTYPMSTVQMSSSGVTASISSGSSNTVISTSGTVSAVLTGGTASGLYTYGKVGFFEATITGMSSTTGLAVGNWIQATNGTGSLYGGVPDFVEITSIESATSIKYRVKGGTTPTAGTVTNISTRGNDGGTGISLWVTDSGNWWGVSYGRTIDTACNCSTCNSGSCSSYANYASSYCGGYSNYASGYCGGWSTTTQGYCNGWSTTTQGYCNGWSTNLTSSCNGWSTNLVSSCNGWTNNAFSYCNFYTQNFQFTCQQYSGPSGGTCNFWVGANRQCVSWQGGTYSCSSGTSGYVTNCGQFSWGFASTCTGGSTYSYSQSCTGGSTYGYSQSCSGGVTYANVNYCSGGITYNNVSYCSGGVYTTYAPACSAGTYTAYAPACSLTTYAYSSCNCQTCYPGYIRIFQSASNAITEVARWTLTSMAAAFKVVTNKANKIITIKPYRDKALSSQIGSDLTYTASAATIETKFGIVLSPSDYIQGNQADDFNIASN